MDPMESQGLPMGYYGHPTDVQCSIKYHVHPIGYRGRPMGIPQSILREQF